METSKEMIRKAIMKNRGGHETATDEQIMTLWNSLMPDTQKQYLESIKVRSQKSEGKKEKEDAVSNESKRNI